MREKWGTCTTTGKDRALVGAELPPLARKRGTVLERLIRAGYSWGKTVWGTTKSPLSARAPSRSSEIVLMNVLRKRKGGEFSEGAVGEIRGKGGRNASWVPDAPCRCLQLGQHFVGKKLSQGRKKKAVTKGRGSGQRLHYILKGGVSRPDESRVLQGLIPRRRC